MARGHAENDEQSPKKIVLPISGMSCATCARTIEKALGKSAGVLEARVNLATEKASVTYDPSAARREDLVRVVREVGYDVPRETMTVTLRIGGMTCATCAQTIEKALRGTPGVLDANVNLASERASVTFDRSLANIQRLSRAVEDLGYAYLGTISDEEQRAERATREEAEKLARARRSMRLAWAVTIPIVLWMIPEMFLGISFPNEITLKVGLTALSLVVLSVPGRQTFRTARRAMAHGTPNMDVLIAIGTSASLATGPISLVMPVANFAGIAGMIMSFHLTGRYFEARAKGKASEAIRRLLELGARTARVVRGEEEFEVPVEDLVVGDMLVIRPGEKIPTDATIVEGSTSVDESMATGESMPVSKSSGSTLIGGTVNQRGMVKATATKVGRDTFLSQVIEMVERAQGTKVPVQAFADRITTYFVPVVILLAVASFLSWVLFGAQLSGVLRWASAFLPWVDPTMGTLTLALFASIAVLVIACPCALGLATPTALMVGSGIGAEHGVLIREGAAIQILRDVKTIVFDKTGTLTEGRPRLLQIKSLTMEEAQLLALAAGAEAGSEHPLARAVIEGAEERGIEVPRPRDFESSPGRGIRARVDGKLVEMGRAEYFSANLPSRLMSIADVMQARAMTTIIISVDGEFAGVLGVADALKDDSRQAIDEIRSLGIEPVMITGDNRQTALAIARDLGMDRVLAQVLPHEKAAEVARLQEEAGPVAMVGDGINDAPALAQADVGIAIGTGTDVAIESSDVTLVRGDLSSVVTAIKLSRETFKKIKQNLFWAFAYNVVAIPLAFMGLLHPAVAEAAMATSSVTVVTNANLLRRARIS